jgi:low affinity Fe/Cu permease
VRERFRKFAHETARVVGTSWAFFAACVLVLLWAVTGPIFHFSDTWQLVINTGTTIITFLMVFVIQATQNRDSKAIHLKLDELLRAGAKSRTGLVGLENMSEQELRALEVEFAAIKARQARRTIREKS